MSTTTTTLEQDLEARLVALEQERDRELARIEREIGKTERVLAAAMEIGVLELRRRRKSAREEATSEATPEAAGAAPAGDDQGVGEPRSAGELQSDPIPAKVSPEESARLRAAEDTTVDAVKARLGTLVTRIDVELYVAALHHDLRRHPDVQLAVTHRTNSFSRKTS